MHVYVQKSTRTTLPRRPAIVSGRSLGVLNQSEMPTKFGALPKSSSELEPAARETAFGSVGMTFASAWFAVALRSTLPWNQSV